MTLAHALHLVQEFHSSCPPGNPLSLASILSLISFCTSPVFHLQDTSTQEDNKNKKTIIEKHIVFQSSYEWTPNCRNNSVLCESSLGLWLCDKGSQVFASLVPAFVLLLYFAFKPCSAGNSERDEKRGEIPLCIHSSLYIQTDFEGLLHGMISCQAFPVLTVSELSLQASSQAL